jgi:hypothetical protein
MLLNFSVVLLRHNMDGHILLEFCYIFMNSGNIYRTILLSLAVWNLQSIDLHSF